MTKQKIVKLKKFNSKEHNKWPDEFRLPIVYPEKQTTTKRKRGKK